MSSKRFFPQSIEKHMKKSVSLSQNPTFHTFLHRSPEETAALLSAFAPGAARLTTCSSVPVCSLSLLPSDFDPWSLNDCEQNKSESIPANCTGCAQILPLKVTLPEDTPKTFERLRPLVIKVGKKPGFPMDSLPLKGWIKPCKAVVANCPSVSFCVTKTGQPLLSSEIQRFSCQYPEAAEGFTEGLFTRWWRCFPERWFPFSYPW